MTKYHSNTFSVFGKKTVAVILMICLFVNSYVPVYAASRSENRQSYTNNENPDYSYSNIHDTDFDAADEHPEQASEEEKILTLFRKSEIAEDKWAEAVNVLTQIQNCGYDFDTASVIFSAVCTGLFTVEEAILLFEQYDDTQTFKQALVEFSNFSVLFDVAETVNSRNLTKTSFGKRTKLCKADMEVIKKTVAKLQATEPSSTQIVADTSAVVSSSFKADAQKIKAAASDTMFQKAKALLLEGNSANEVKNAICYAAATNRDPAIFLDTVKSATSPSKENASLYADANSAAEETALQDGYGLMLLANEPSWDPSAFIQSPVSVSVNLGESIDMYTGGVVYETTLVDIPGANGLDLTVKIKYRSDEAKHADEKAGVNYRDGYNYSHWLEPYNQADENTKNKALFDIGAGWSYDFAYFWNDELYIPGKGKYQWDTKQQKLKDYELDDIVVTENPSDDMIPAWLNASRVGSIVWLATGTTYYFDGTHILGIGDRFGNYIKYTYSIMGKLESISTSNGATVSFSYSNYSNTSSERYIDITTQDGKSRRITLQKTTSAVNVADNTVTSLIGDYVVSSLTMPDNETTDFEYKVCEFDFNLWGANYTYWDPLVGDTVKPAVGKNYSSLLAKIQYPGGAASCFEYYPYLWTEPSDDGVRYCHYFWADTCRVLDNNTTYAEATYWNNSLTQTGGTKIGYTYIDGDVEKTELYQTYVNGNYTEELLQRVSYTRNDAKLVENETTTDFYGDFSRVTQKLYEYDNMGNVTAYWSPLAEGDKANTLYKTEYQYFISSASTETFVPPLSVLTLKKWTQDAQTEIWETRELNATHLPASVTVYEVPPAATENTSDTPTISISDILKKSIKRQRNDYTYDTSGNITSVKQYPNIENSDDYILQTIEYKNNTLPSKVIIQGVKDADGNLIGQNGALSTTFVYDIMWNKTKETYADGMSLAYTYDGNRRVTSVQCLSADGQIAASASYAYDTELNQVTFTDPSGENYIYKYTGFGSLDYVKNPLGVITQRNVYNSRGLVQTVYNAADENTSNKSEYTYDALGRAISCYTEATFWTPFGERSSTGYIDILNASGDSEISVTKFGSSEYTTNNNIQSPQKTTYIVNDKYGRKIKEGITGAAETAYTYDHLGNLIHESNPITDNTYTYDYAGNVISVQNKDGSSATNTYDSIGRLIRSTDFAGNETLYTYDTLGRLIEKKVQQSGTGTNKTYLTVKSYYDTVGNLIKEKSSAGTAENPSWNEITYQYDSIGRLVQRTVGNITEAYTYNALGGVTSHTVGDSVTSYAYDRLGRQTSMTDALGQTESYAYDNNGYLIQKTDRNGSVFNLTYNYYGQLMSESGPSYSKYYSYYGGLGLLAAVETNGVKQSYTYDDVGRLVSQQDPGNVQKTYTYNTVGLRTSFTLKKNNVVELALGYTYDASGRLSAVTEDETSVVSYAYDTSGKRISETKANGVQVTYAYNAAGQITDMANKKGETVLSEYQYTYGLDGNMSEKSDHAGNRTTYAYNAQGMLAREAVYADTALTSQSVYAYDNRGNRITKTDTAGESRLVTGYTYDANDRLTKRSVGEYNARVDTIYTYDANGNLYTSFGRSYTMNPYHKNSLLASVASDSMGITQYTFNTVNQLVGVQKDGLTATYSYLPDGMRSEKTVNGVTTGHLWDGTNMVAETSGDAVVYKYVRGAGLLYTENAADEKTWYVKDAHGDTVQFADGICSINRERR